MKFYNFIILLLIFVRVSQAQKVRFSGVVQDSIGKPLASASVVAANLQTKAFQGFAITDDKGTFVIEMQPQTTYTVKVSYMGYRAIIDTLAVKDQDIFKKYMLKVDKQQLDGVEVKYEMPVTVKGDTIIYNADSFTTGNEKKLGDVLKKMPGIDVDKDGTVKVEGQKVKKVMVEGKNFFEGDSKLASKNIPANAVKKVEVLRNFNENSQLRSFEDNDDSYALNIRLKEGKKNFLFGEVSLGGGTGKRYLAHPKLFYYSPKKTYNIIADANNTGDVPLTFMDYFKMTGGLSRMMRKGGSTFSTSTDMLGFSLIPNNKAKAVETQFGAFNFNFTLNPKWTWDGFVMFNHNQTDMQTRTEKIYSTNNLKENSQDMDTQKTLSGIFKTSFRYDPNENLNFKYDILAKYVTVNQKNIFQSNIRANNTSQKSQVNQSLSQNFEVYQTLKNGNLATFSVKHSYENNQPLLEAVSPQMFFATSSLINLTPQNTYDLLQNKYLDQQDLSALVDYYLVINDQSHIDLALGSRMVWQDLKSDLQQIFDNGQAQILNPSQLKNDARYCFTDIFAGAYYKVMWKKFVLRPGVSWHYYHLNDTQFDDEKVQNLWALLPELKLKYRFNRGKRMSFSYKLTRNYSDINKYIQGYVLNGFSSLQAGNRKLKPVLQHQFSLRYSSFSMLHFSHFFTGITYNKSVNSIRNKTEVLQTDFISKPVNITNSDQNLSLYASYGKRYVYWKYSLRANVSAAEYYSIINGNEVASQSLNQNYGVKVNSNLSGFFNFDLGYDFNMNHFENNLRKSIYLTDKSSAGIELRFFKKTTQLNINYEYYNYRDDQNTTHNHYAFLSTELFYQKTGSAWELSLKGTNLLQTDTLDKENLTDLYIVSSKYYVMPNYWLLTVRYKL